MRVERRDLRAKHPETFQKWLARVGRTGGHAWLAADGSHAIALWMVRR